LLRQPCVTRRGGGKVTHAQLTIPTSHDYTEGFVSLVDALIPEDLEDFILRYIDSIAQLEALLLLRRHPKETWTVERAAKRLYIDETEAKAVLDRLCADDLLTCDEGDYHYFGQSDEQRQMIDRLAEVYSRHLIPVTNLIHTKPPRLREFADAFKIRKERT
jgi:hypothetical protein